MDDLHGRRAVLGSVAGVTAATAGCLSELNALLRGRPRGLRLTILTPAPDTDPFAPAIARRVADALTAAGVRTSLQPSTESSFWRDVLINGDFDLYVGRHPVGRDPTVFGERFHSRFGEEIGWQNPTGIADDTLDERLEALRYSAADSRTEATDGVLERLAELVPIAPVCVPHDRRVQRAHADLEWGRSGIRNALSYLGSSTSSETIAVGIASDFDGWNLNPLWVESRDRTVVVDLLYDRLAVEHEGQPRPWLAADWTVDGGADGDDGSETVLEVRLREDLAWHDGTELTAADVAFTYRLLWDTTLDSSRPAVPAPRYRGLAALVRSVDRVDSRTVRLAVDASESIAPWTLTVPILPSHVWEPRAERSRFGGSQTPVTRAITTTNESPIGSGPYRYLRSDRRAVVLERWDDHFLARSPDGFPAEIADPDRPARLEFVGLTSRDLARTFLERGDLDAATLQFSPAESDRLGKDVRVETTDPEPGAVYGIGFNSRRHPLGVAAFRRVVSRLVDRPHLAETVFGGRADPSASIGAGSVSLPPALEWDESAPPIDYLGSGGEPDAERIRAAFRDAGYRYSNGGDLLVRR